MAKRIVSEKKKKAGAGKAKPARRASSKSAKKQSAKAAAKATAEDDEMDGIPDLDGDDDDLPPEDVASIDADSVADEVERAEAKGSGDDAESAEDVVVALPASAATGENIDADDTGDGEVLPSMEGMSILRKTELNEVINEVKRRAESNGGFVTYEELNQMLPSTIVDAIQSDTYLKMLDALGVQVIR